MLLIVYLILLIGILFNILNFADRPYDLKNRFEYTDDYSSGFWFGIWTHIIMIFLVFYSFKNFEISIIYVILYLAIGFIWVKIQWDIIVYYKVHYVKAAVKQKEERNQEDINKTFQYLSYRMDDHLWNSIPKAEYYTASSLTWIIFWPYLVFWEIFKFLTADIFSFKYVNRKPTWRFDFFNNLTSKFEKKMDDKVLPLFKRMRELDDIYEDKKTKMLEIRIRETNFLHFKSRVQKFKKTSLNEKIKNFNKLKQTKLR